MVQAATRRYRSDLAAVGTAVGAQVRDIAKGATTADIDGWYRRQRGQLERVTGNGFRLATSIGVNYLAASALEAGVLAATGIPPAVLDVAQLATALRVSGPVAFKRNVARTGDPLVAGRVMTQMLTGSSQRLSMLGARATVNSAIDAGANQIVGYRRVTAAGACDFCTMLAGRGAVFRSAESAATVVGRGGRPRGNRAVGRPFHDNCRCVIEPIYGDGTAGPLVDPTGRNLVARNEARAGRLARRARIEEARAAAQAQLEAERAAALGRRRPPDPELLERWGITEEQFAQARVIVGDVKADIRRLARREADELGGWLGSRDLDRISRPARLRQERDIATGVVRRRRDQSGFDFMEQLDGPELRRVRERMTDSDLFSPDLLAEQVRRVTNLDLTDDEAMNWVVDRWLHEDGLRSLASGRIPRYADPNNLIPADYDLGGYDLERLFGVDLDEAAGHVAAVQAQEAELYARRVLGDPTTGPAPWRMDPADYARELDDVEGLLARSIDDPTFDRGVAETRLRELLPADLDVAPDANPYEIHETIRLTAQTAGLA